MQKWMDSVTVQQRYNYEGTAEQIKRTSDRIRVLGRYIQREFAKGILDGDFPEARNNGM